MTDHGQHLVIVSGLSGGGKSTALHALEDLDFYCVDNLPPALLNDFASQIRADSGFYEKVALGIDARAPAADLGEIPGWLNTLKGGGLRCQLLFLDADDTTLATRFSETRRRHPLSRGQHSLAVSIKRERELLEPIRHCADWVVDTSAINIHQLRHQVWKCVGPDSGGMTLVLQSFAFKHGLPNDVDFVFDARSLPNPYWKPELRPLTGKDPEVMRWLEQDEKVTALAEDIHNFLARWLPEFQRAQESYVTIGIGCTGGRHRSVYLVERLASALQDLFPEVMIHHRELKK